MNIPFWSIFTLVTEIIVTTSVLFIVHRGYKQGIFLRALAWWTLAYEIGVNVSYMLSRALAHLPEHTSAIHKPYEIGIAIFHGVFSLVMLVGLVVFLVLANREYGKGINFFLKHYILTFTFLTLWSASLFSGVLLFFMVYF